jgi:hypothetical protein
LWLVSGFLQALFGLLAEIFGSWSTTKAIKPLVKVWWEDGETW